MSTIWILTLCREVLTRQNDKNLQSYVLARHSKVITVNNGSIVLLKGTNKLNEP